MQCSHCPCLQSSPANTRFVDPIQRTSAFPKFCRFEIILWKVSKTSVVHLCIPKSSAIPKVEVIIPNNWATALPLEKSLSFTKNFNLESSVSGAVCAVNSSQLPSTAYAYKRSRALKMSCCICFLKKVKPPGCEASSIQQIRKRIKEFQDSGL